MAEVELNASDPFPGVRAIATMARQIDSVFTANHPSLSKFTSIGIGRATVIFSGVKYEVATEGDYYRLFFIIPCILKLH